MRLRRWVFSTRMTWIERMITDLFKKIITYFTQARSSANPSNPCHPCAKNRRHSCAEGAFLAHGLEGFELFNPSFGIFILTSRFVIQ